MGLRAEVCTSALKIKGPAGTIDTHIKMRNGSDTFSSGWQSNAHDGKNHSFLIRFIALVILVRYDGPSGTNYL